MKNHAKPDLEQYKKGHVLEKPKFIGTYKKQ